MVILALSRRNIKEVSKNLFLLLSLNISGMLGRYSKECRMKGNR